ncbi:hypothetical protein GCM10007967_23480 [Xylanimonas ulmi]|uniref:Uncharacterized protein n=2 Tax=Xylanimonas ulmi TaxID=228973 RepID=A0A4Q7M486_9MICO|nr:hypothetical protein EV386_3104 [Xylanibacterium ulmi]
MAQRTEAARVQADRLRARQDAVHEQAEGLLREFLPVVLAHGPAPTPLRVRGYGGRGEARTPLRGWHLRLDRTAALGADGHFYVLIAPLSALDRVRGVRPAPARPPMVLGEGGKDGESVELPVALERVLPGWRELA